MACCMKSTQQSACCVCSQSGSCYSDILKNLQEKMYNSYFLMLCIKISLSCIQTICIRSHFVLGNKETKRKDFSSLSLLPIMKTTLPYFATFFLLNYQWPKFIFAPSSSAVTHSYFQLSHQLGYNIKYPSGDCGSHASFFLNYPIVSPSPAMEGIAFLINFFSVSNSLLNKIDEPALMYYFFH